MPTTADRVLRDFVRYTGDGLPNEPTGAPLPIGDPASGVHNPSKADLREAVDSVTGSADAALAAAGSANSAAAAANAVVAQQPPIVVLAEGQSNMRSISDQTGGDLSSNPRLFAWNSQVAPAANGDAWVPMTIGANPFVGTPGVNNLAFQFCKELQRRTGRLVYLILVAAGGHSIEAFMNSTDLANNGWSQTAGQADLFSFAQTQLAAALPQVPGAPTSVDYFIWHQGEANKEEQVEVYARKLRILLKRLELNGTIVRNKTDVIAGEIFDGATHGRFKDRHASALRRLQMGTYEDAFPRFKVAHSHGLQAVTLIDDIHFSGEDITALGKRYVDAAFSEQMPPELDPTTADLSVDSGLAWATNLAAATSHVSYWRRQPYYLGSTPTTIENNGTLGWCHVAPSNVNTMLISRKLFQTPVEAQFLIELEVLNAHPSAVTNFRLGVAEYDGNKAYLGLNLMTNQSAAAGARARHAATFGSSTGSRSNMRNFGANARWFAPFVQFNWDGTGAGARFNFTGMRWI